MKSASSGACRLNSASTLINDQTNMPAFQRKFPLRMNDSATLLGENSSNVPVGKVTKDGNHKYADADL